MWWNTSREPVLGRMTLGDYRYARGLVELNAEAQRSPGYETDETAEIMARIDDTSRDVAPWKRYTIAWHYNDRHWEQAMQRAQAAVNASERALEVEILPTSEPAHSAATVQRPRSVDDRTDNRTGW